METLSMGLMGHRDEEFASNGSSAAGVLARSGGHPRAGRKNRLQQRVCALRTIEPLSDLRRGADTGGALRTTQRTVARPGGVRP